MTERRLAAKECVDRCIKNYNLQKFIDEGKMNYENSINELRDYVELVSSPKDAVNSDHVRSEYKGPALFALMGNELPGNGKEDFKITSEQIKTILSILLKIPKDQLKNIPINDIPVFYRQRVLDFFSKQSYSSRLEMERELFENWIPKHI